MMVYDRLQCLGTLKVNQQSFLIIKNHNVEDKPASTENMSTMKKNVDKDSQMCEKPSQELKAECEVAQQGNRVIWSNFAKYRNASEENSQKMGRYNM